MSFAIKQLPHTHENEFVAQLDLFIKDIRAGRVVEHTLDGRLVTKELDPRDWCKKLSINNSDVSDSVPASDILKDLELLVLTASRLNLRDKCREQIKKIEGICLMFIFGISKDHEKFQFIPDFMKVGALIVLQLAKYGNAHMCEYFQALSNSTITIEHLRYSGVDNKGPTTIFMAIQMASSGDTVLWNLIKTQFKDKLRIDDFRARVASGPNAGVTCLWSALFAARNGHPEVWNWVVDKFGDKLRIDDFRTASPHGSGLWLALHAARRGHPEVWDWLVDELKDYIRMDDFRTSPAEGPYAGKTGLWIAVHAWLDDKKKKGVWNWVIENFGDKLTIEDFRTAPSGDNAWRTCLWSAISAVGYDEPEMWDWVVDNFGDKLRIDDFRTASPHGSGLWLAIDAAFDGYPELWNWLVDKWEDDLRMDDFRTSPPQGDNAGQTGLWIAVMAWLQGEERVWNWLSGRFKGELRPDDILVKPESGGNESILEAAANAANEGHPEIMQWIIGQLNVN